MSRADEQQPPAPGDERGSGVGARPLAEGSALAAEPPADGSALSAEPPADGSALSAEPSTDGSALGAEPPAVVGLEREVLEEVWEAGDDASVREVLDALNARAPKQRAYTTLMTVLVRLHAKGLLVRRRDGRSDRYSAAFTREQYLAARARAEVDALVGEFGDVALAHFARQVGELDPERRARLERLAAGGADTPS